MDKTIPFYIEVVSVDSSSYSRPDEPYLSFWQVYSGESSTSFDELLFSYDNITWTNVTNIPTYGDIYKWTNLSVGDRIYIKAVPTNNHYYESYKRLYLSTGQFSVREAKIGGNIMSLFYGSNFTGNETTFPQGSNSRGLFGVNFIKDASQLLLPATTLSGDVYQYMFNDSSFVKAGLVKAPIITQATIQSGYPYDFMFEYCNNLESITIENTNIRGADYILYRMSPKTIVYKKEGVTTPSNPNNLTVVTLKNTPFNVANAKKWKINGFNVNKVVDSQNRVIWERYGKKDPTVPFYMENTGDTDILMELFPDTYSHPGVTLFGSTDKVTWNQLGVGNRFSFTVPANSKLYLQATFPSGLGWGLTSEDGLGINFKGDIQKVGGNIMSLIYGTNFTDKVAMNNSGYTFSFLFSHCEKLVDISELILPATTLSKGCYESMFFNCTFLKDASMIELPATTLSDGCYNGMFSNCTRLVEGPDLPAKVLTNSCYEGIFYYCSSLNSINCYATDISASGCLTRWVDHVPASGTIVKKAGVSYPSGVSGIPSGWTVIEV